MKQILVTGGAGYIGTHVLAALSEADLMGEEPSSVPNNRMPHVCRVETQRREGLIGRRRT